LEYVPLPIPGGVRIVICNTMVKHAIASGEYNLRRAECEEAVRVLSDSLPKVRALRDATLEDVERHRADLGETIYRRSKHVVTENARVLEAKDALETGDLDRAGLLMAQSHQSLKEDFEVSCPELDLMVELASRSSGVRGARMTGGGFGGCTVNLVDEDRVDE